MAPRLIKSVYNEAQLKSVYIGQTSLSYRMPFSCYYYNVTMNVNNMFFKIEL